MLANLTIDPWGLTGAFAVEQTTSGHARIQNGCSMPIWQSIEGFLAMKFKKIVRQIELWP